MSETARLDALETRIAYQDEAIEELNKTVASQWKEIDRMTRELAQMADRVAAAERAATGSGEDEPPPPHY